MTYNPEGLRIGTKVLRQHRKGRPVAAYYPDRAPGLKHVLKAFGPHLTTYDERKARYDAKMEECVARSLLGEMLCANWL